MASTVGVTSTVYHDGVATKDGRESIWRWMVGVLLAIAGIAATLLAADKIHLPSQDRPSAPSNVDNGPRLGFEPSGARPGAAVTVRVSGFGPDEVVTIRFREVTLSSLVTDGSGSVESSVTIPDGAPGQTTVTAQGRTSGRTATFVFQMLG